MFLVQGKEVVLTRTALTWTGTTMWMAVWTAILRRV